ncbi:MAG TPA: glucose 1-dehydrogenase [Gammaproteobacteria bacterium]|nr:glucose 1-dehydrogenase [Gammaproteobacteria bacterium]
MQHVPDLGLSGQVAIVTGATSGLGRASALALAQAGAQVVVNHLPRSAAAAAEVVAEIEAAGGTVLTSAADVSLEQDVEAMFAEAVQHFGTVHILVNNAGIEQGAPFQEMSLAQWQRVIDVNLTGQFLCARAAVREFFRRGPQPEVSCALGKIICMSSVHQAIPWAFQTNYAASKGGVLMLMQSLAQELAPHRIRVNAIAPGAIRTPINRQVWENETALGSLLELIPYGRIGAPEDIATTVLWLASDLSDYMIGTTVFVDGGMTLYPSFRGNG